MIENKYASALDGLEIEDPVKSFFDFCKEREKIRISRENGEDFPWSADEIFQKLVLQMLDLVRAPPHPTPHHT